MDKGLRWGAMAAVAICMGACGSGDEGQRGGSSGAGGAATASGGSSSGGSSSGGSSSGGSSGGGGGVTSTGGTPGAGGQGAGPPCMVQDPPSLSEIAQKELIRTATGLGGPRSLRVFGNALYFIEGDSLFRLAFGATTAEVVTSLGGSERLLGLSFNDTHVFFVVEGKVMRAPSDATGATRETVVDGVNITTSGIVGVDATHVYLQEAGTISSVPVAGGTRQTLASDVRRSLGISAGYLYFSRLTARAEDDIVRMPTAGGAEVVLGSARTPAGVNGDASTVFIGTGGALIRLTIASREKVELLSLPIGGFPDSSQVSALNVRGDTVYFGTGEPVIGWVATDGKSCGSIVSLESPFDTWTMSSTDLYVAGSQGIHRIALPAR